MPIVRAELVTDELIAADKRLDVIGGSAGAILCLLRLYRDGQSEAVLRRAVKCGEHLLATTPVRGARAPQLGGAGSGFTPAQRNVTWCGRICICARLFVGRDRAGRFRCGCTGVR